MGKIVSTAWLCWLSVWLICQRLVSGDTCSNGARNQAEGASMLSAKTTKGRMVGALSDINESLTDLLTDSLVRDVNDTAQFPDAEANSSNSSEHHHGLGSLSQPFTFLYAKVAELETAVELQNMEIKALTKMLEEKSQQMAGLLAAVQLHIQQPDHKHDQKQLKQHVTEAETNERAAHQKHREKVSQLQKDKSVHVLRSVLGKHAHQHNHGFTEPAPQQPAPDPRAPEAPEASPGAAESLKMRASALQEGSDVRELDDAVAGKMFDAVSDAYNDATDKVSFVANTVIDTVEHAMAILTQGFDFGASCPDMSWPSVNANSDRVKINFGRQKCQATLVGQTITLFNFNFGEKSFDWPGPIATIAKLGSAIADCVGEGASLDALSCFAKVIGNTMLNVVPPLSFLAKMQDIMEEFIVVFAKMASKLVEKAMSDSGTFIQEAVQTQTKFPEVGSAAVVKKFHKNFELRLSSRKPKAQKAPKPSLLETRRERRGDDDKPEGGLGFGAADYVPQEHKLITQFNGVETDSGSCLAFAPSVRGGPGNTVEPRDWQTPGRQSDNVPSEFVKLEPWAVPCANAWMKDNPSKWQGYSFYTWETPLERCATVVYSLGLQPVLAFVGGLEFDMMPSPIAEVETFVCWPDTQPGGVDLSAIEMHIMSGGVPLLTRTIRLKKRFGSGTGFSNGNIGATTASGKANFGVPEDGADDSGLNAMDRDSLLQANASGESHGFMIEQEHFIASMLYDDEMGTNVTESFHGAEAARRMKPLFPKAESLVEAQGQATDEHVLFSFRSPSNGLVGFEIQGLLSDNKLQLSVQMQFGPITTPRKRMTIMDLAQQLQIILTAIPFISVSSKATAVQAMSNFDTLAESHMPTSTDQGIGAFTNYWIISGENHRSGQRGKMIYWGNGPKSDPFNSAPTSGWRLVSDGNGQFWLVTGYAQSQAGKMVYVKNGAFHSYNFNEDAKCKWKLEEDGGEYWLVTGPEHHTPGQMLYLTGSGWSLWNFGRDQKCKFRVVEVEFKIQPFMLSPAEVWIVTAPDHREEDNMDNRMIFWKAGGPDNYALNYDPACRWILKPNGNGEYWLVTGSGSDSPGKMVYLKSDTFSVWNWNEDPKCLFKFVSAGDGAFWLVTASTHWTPNKMIYLVGGVWGKWNFNHDLKTKFNLYLSS